MRLISIKGSHYVERARWALDLAGIPYEEDCFPPVVHMGASSAATTKNGCSKGKKSSSVPILITGPEAHHVLADSAHIVKFCHEIMGESSTLYPSDQAQCKEIEEIETLCATKLGVYARVVAYQYGIFSNGSLTVKALCQGVPTSRKLIFRFLFYLIVPLMKAAMKINEENAEACLEKAEKIMAELSDRLTKAGGQYLVGNKFSAADLTFASMAAHLVIPPSGFGADLSGLEVILKNPRIVALRDTIAGKHCIRMFAEHRIVAAAQLLGSKM